MAEVLLGGANLLFASKVTETARALGLSAEAVPAEALAGRAGEARLVLVDLERVTPEQLRAVRAATKARLIGFASHAEEAVLDQAREAGCDEVLSRGQFSAQLPRLLAR